LLLVMQVLHSLFDNTIIAVLPNLLHIGATCNIRNSRTSHMDWMALVCRQVLHIFHERTVLYLIFGYKVSAEGSRPLEERVAPS
jgi:hypothetical protein